MEENRVMNHTTRNIYLYIMLFFILNTLFTYSIPAEKLFLGLLIFIVAYIPVYFLNDYSDRHEDKGVFNLYHVFHSHIFWSSAVLISATGIIATIFFSRKALFLLLVLYALHYAYSWLRYRNKVFFRETLIFIIYIVKLYAITAYLGFPLIEAPAIIFIMTASAAAVSMALYKKHVKRYIRVEMFYGGVFLASFLISAFQYRPMLYVFGPLIPLFAWLMYKEGMIPIGRYQSYYFAFAIIVLANL